jgi:RimJ/RimL family protein N-acetyltransferase
MTHYESSDGLITIRPIVTADTDTIFAAIRESLVELYTWMAWAHPEYSLEETAVFTTRAEASWADGSGFPFAITDDEDGRFLGTVGLNRIDREYQMCNLGYWIRTGETGRGLAARATRLAGRFGLRELGLQRIEIVALTDNLASQRTAEKAGAHREGILRHRLIKNGEPRDAAMYSLITGDFAD